MAARTGAEFLKGLQGEREIWLGEERVDNVVEHPAFAGAAKGLAAVFDLQHEKADVCLMPDPETGEPINISHMRPKSREDLKKRHQCLQTIAEYSVGLMGRTPDYMNVTFAGFAARTDEWGAAGNEQGAENLDNYQKFLARNDIALTHTIVHPIVDKTQGGGPVPGDDICLRKVGETEHGIIVRGARVLATLAPFSDELAVYPGAPNAPDTPEFALSFCIPMSTPGLKFICRDSVSVPGSVRDQPFSSRFDEQDAFIVFDDVEVPRDRVFIDGHEPVYNTVTRTGWYPNITQQTMIRAQTKLEFAWGLAQRMAEAINDQGPATQNLLGELRMYADLTAAAVLAAEEQSYDHGNGAWFCNGAPMYALKAALPGWMPRMNEIIRAIGAHHLLTAPSQALFRDPKLGPLLGHHLRGSNDIDAEERARIFRLAWDFIGSGLGSRNDLYERFYLGSQARNFATVQRVAQADRARGDRLVGQFLNEN